MGGRILLYGANGYTGRLTAKLARDKGQSLILAGRNGALIKAQADGHSFEWRAFDLTDPDTIDRNLEDVDVVLHMAGPFSATMAPMLDACLRTKTHYLDITGEIDVIEALSGRFADAQAAGIMMMPGAGFDVVPSDCLLAHVKNRLPEAKRLTLAIEGLTSMSRGTAKTAIESLGQGMRLRRKGRIVTLGAPRRRDFDFGHGPVDCVGVGWGDVSSAYHSTAVPNIQVYFAVTPDLERAAKLSSLTRWFLRRRLIQDQLKRAVEKRPDGPNREERAKGRATLLGVAEDGEGGIAVSRLTTPEPYSLTARVALDMAVKAAGKTACQGFFTPTRFQGADYILGFDGVRREDIV